MTTYYIEVYKTSREDNKLIPCKEEWGGASVKYTDLERAKAKMISICENSEGVVLGHVFEVGRDQSVATWPEAKA